MSTPLGLPASIYRMARQLAVILVALQDEIETAKCFGLFFLRVLSGDPRCSDQECAR
jgi:hypothetical protein